MWSTWRSSCRKRAGSSRTCARAACLHGCRAGAVGVPAYRRRGRLGLQGAISRSSTPRQRVTGVDPLVPGFVVVTTHDSRQRRGSCGVERGRTPSRPIPESLYGNHLESARSFHDRSGSCTSLQAGRPGLLCRRPAGQRRWLHRCSSGPARWLRPRWWRRLGGLRRTRLCLARPWVDVAIASPVRVRLASSAPRLASRLALNSRPGRCPAWPTWPTRRHAPKADERFFIAGCERSNRTRLHGLLRRPRPGWSERSFTPRAGPTACRRGGWPHGVDSTPGSRRVAEVAHERSP